MKKTGLEIVQKSPAVGSGKEIRMKRRMLASVIVLFLGLAGACRKAPSDQEAIRTGIQRHLNEHGGLNLAAMDVKVERVSISGDQAEAQVEFRLKQGGASMRVAYALGRKGGSWVVVRSKPVGGEIEHPPMNQQPQGVWREGTAQSRAPSLSDLTETPPTAATKSLPPGHRPVGEAP